MPKLEQRTVAFLVLAATQLMVILDGTIVTVALPAIRSGLGFSEIGLPWVVDTFFVAFAAVLLPSGRLGDRVGARIVFLGGLALFTLASLACGLAVTPAALLLARAVQGVGGGLATAVSLGMIATLYPESALRMRAFAVLAFVGSAGASIGLVTGGVLIQLASWQWVFLVNVPIGVVGVGIGLRVLRRTPGQRVQGGLVPRALFTDPAFALANGVLFSMTMAGMSFQYLSSLFLQDNLRLGPLATGFGFLIVSGMIAISSLGLSGRLAARIGAAATLIIGVLVFATGMVPMVWLRDDASFWPAIAAPFLIMGLGFGLAMPQATGLAMGAAPAELAGIASGFVNTTQQAGGAIGLFAVTAIAAATERGVGFLIAAVGLLVGAGLAAVLRRTRAGKAEPARV